MRPSRMVVVYLATLAGWPMSVTLIDLGWGAAASAAASTLGWATARRVDA